MQNALVIAGATAGVVTGGFFVYGQVMRRPQNEWVEDPPSGADQIRQGTDVLPVQAIELPRLVIAALRCVACEAWE